MYNYVVIVVSGYWASCQDTGQHRSSVKIFRDGNKGKKGKLSFVILRTK